MTDSYPKFGKIPRLHRDVVITEKLDGTNGLVSIRACGPNETTFASGEHLIMVAGQDGTEPLVIRAGSRNRWLTPESDNFGFAAWVRENATELATLGVGHHHGEWYGKGIQRGYGLTERRFALFNAGRWFDSREEADTYRLSFPGAQPCPAACEVVTVLSLVNAIRLNLTVNLTLKTLERMGSLHVPGYERPEGVVVYHMAGDYYLKALLEGDDIPKGQAEAA